jgi:transcriptional regulator with XRE-family HTH domain
MIQPERRFQNMAQPRKRSPEDHFYGDLGGTIRLARVAAGKTQTDLAEHLDVSHHQFQKYETGTNRIPVQELARVANYLEVPVAQFFSPTDTEGGDSALRSLVEDLGDKELLTLVETWKALKDRRMRAALLNYLKSVAALNR